MNNLPFRDPTLLPRRAGSKGWGANISSLPPHPALHTPAALALGIPPFSFFLPPTSFPWAGVLGGSMAEGCPG